MASLIYFTIQELLRKHVALVSAVSVGVMLCEFQDMLPGSDTVSLHMKNQSVAGAIRSIEWQGWVKIVSNVDGSARLSIDLDHVSVAQALAEISRQTHSRWSWAWFVAQNPAKISQGETTFADSRSIQAEGWTVLSRPMTSMNEESPTGVCHNLQENLKIIADEEGTPVIVPANWNPRLAFENGTGKSQIYSLVPDLATWAGGSSERVIILNR